MKEQFEQGLSHSLSLHTMTGLMVVVVEVVGARVVDRIVGGGCPGVSETAIIGCPAANRASYIISVSYLVVNA